MASKSTAGLVAVALIAAAATPLVAASTRRAAAPPPPPPAEFVRARIAGYREMGSAFKNINDSLRTGSPDIMLIQQSARTVKNTSQAQYGWFPAGTGPAPGLKTSAKPEIWTKPAEFRAAQDQLSRAADALQAAAASRNTATIQAAVRGLGGACKNCHDQFRVPPPR